MISFRIMDPGQVPDAVGIAILVAGEMGAQHDFTVGPMDDKQLQADLTLWVDGPDEVEAAEVLGQRFITAGVAFDGV